MLFSNLSNCIRSSAWKLEQVCSSQFVQCGRPPHTTPRPFLSTPWSPIGNLCTHPLIQNLLPWCKQDLSRRQLPRFKVALVNVTATLLRQHQPWQWPPIILATRRWRVCLWVASVLSLVQFLWVRLCLFQLYCRLNRTWTWRETLALCNNVVNSNKQYQRFRVYIQIPGAIEITFRNLSSYS